MDTLLSQLKEVRRERSMTLTLSILIFFGILLNLGIGALQVSVAEVFQILSEPFGLSFDARVDDVKEAVVLHIRLPRVFLGLIVGGGLGIAGAFMQGIFRNPLADPGLIGVSAGAALAASLFIVLGSLIEPLAGEWGLSIGTPLCAFVGALSITYLVWRMGTQGNRVSVSRLLLAGIAINALVGAVIGSLTLVATDSQLRDLTFWSLGSLNSANWPTVISTALGVLPIALITPKVAKSLDAWLLGEAESHHLGVDIIRLKRLVVGATALAVGSAVAAAGIIGFIGLVVPHLIRLTFGPGHRFILPGSGLLGALILIIADLLARTVIAPVEVPIGIITALGGAPFFLLLLHTTKQGDL